MAKISRLTMIAALAALGAVAFGAQSQASGVRVGTLTCNVSSGWGFIFGSSRDLQCTLSRPNGPIEHYTGRISRFGVDIGYVQSAVIVWGVIAPTTNMAPGSLAGNFGGVTGSATIGVGLGANVLIGGSNQSIALQPLSIEGNTGLNVAGGIASMTLTAAP
ncbi:MAG: DUF992 domain-containing protein [Dongiaceae bacterium]